MLPLTDVTVPSSVINVIVNSNSSKYHTYIFSAKFVSATNRHFRKKRSRLLAVNVYFKNRFIVDYVADVLLEYDNVVQMMAQITPPQRRKEIKWK